MGSERAGIDLFVHERHDCRRTFIADRFHERQHEIQPGLGTTAELGDLFHETIGRRGTSSIQIAVPGFVQEFLRRLGIRDGLLPSVYCGCEVGGHRRQS